MIFIYGSYDFSAILESKDVSMCVTPKTTQTDPVTDRLGTQMVSTDEQQRKAAAILSNGLGDKILRVVANHTKESMLVFKILRERYASSELTTRMSLMSELQSFTTSPGIWEST
jgi:hypothetical protein